MAVKTQTRTRTTSRTQKKRQLFDLPLERRNIIYIGLGIGLVILGYIFMAQNSVNGFLPTSVAPILLVLGYCVLIPYGILKRFSEVREVNEPIITKTTADEKPKTSETVTSEKSTQSSNIKTRK